MQGRQTIEVRRSTRIAEMNTAGLYEPLTVRTEDLQDVRVLHLAGDCDTFNASVLRREVESAVSDCRNVVIDAHNITYIDSSAVAAIVWAQETLIQNRLQLRLVGAHGALSRILRVTHLDAQLEQDQSVEEALISIAGRRT
jgi:anti-anti-sigma factor